VPALCFYCYKDSSINVFGVRDRTGRVRCRSLTLTHFLQIQTLVPQAFGTGSDEQSLLFTHSAVAAPKRLLVAVFSESADSSHAPISPCLLCVFTVTKILQSTFSGCVTAQDYSADVR